MNPKAIFCVIDFKMPNFLRRFPNIIDLESLIEYNIIDKDVKTMTSHTLILGDSRQLNMIPDKSVQLIITSPPYWQLKDYGTEEQIGFNDSYEEYINNLNLVWKECYRVLSEGCRMCINIGDQFARSVYYGRYKVIITRQCQDVLLHYSGC